MSDEQPASRTLRRQLRRLGLESAAPDEGGWRRFLARVDQSYREVEADRYLLERSLELVSAEMQALYERLRQQSEAALTLERDRLQAIIAATGDGLATLDADGRVLSVNPAGEALIGAEAVGRRFAELLLPPAPDPDPGQTWRQDRATLRGAHGPIPVSFTWSPLPPSGAVVVFRDARAQLEIEQNLQRARREAEEGARLKGEFLATISHEIRTPLHAILGMSHLLQTSPEAHPLSPEQRDSVEAIHTSGQHLLRLINDVLDLSRLEAGRLQLEPVEFSIRALLDGLLPLLPEEPPGVTLFTDLPPDLPDRWRGDPGRIRQILLNLVGNALKFTPSGHVRVALDAPRPAPRAPPRLLIAVEDTGVGVHPDDQARLFQPFTQVDSASTRRSGGTGLGLAISRQLAEQMGGAIRLESRPGVGSRFTVDLPLPTASPSAPPRPLQPALGLAPAVLVVGQGAAADALRRMLVDLGADIADPDRADRCTTLLCGAPAPAARHAIAVLSPRDPLPPGASAALRRPIRRDALIRLLSPERKNSPRPSLPPSLPPGLSPATTRPILIAEDNPINQRLLVRMLERLGYDCDIAPDGEEVLARCHDRSYALILMDCMMPRLDGYAATRRLRDLGVPTPILALTANAFAGAADACLAAGMDGLLTKPVDPARLEGALRAYLTPALDRAALLQLRSLLGDIAPIAATFFADAEVGIAQITQSPASPDAALAAHRLASGCGYLGAARLRYLLQQIEARPDRRAELAPLLPGALAQFRAALQDAG